MDLSNFSFVELRLLAERLIGRVDVDQLMAILSVLNRREETKPTDDDLRAVNLLSAFPPRPASPSRPAIAPRPASPRSAIAPRPASPRSASSKKSTVTLKELKEMAKARGLKGYSTYNKDQLLAVLEGRAEPRPVSARSSSAVDMTTLDGAKITALKKIAKDEGLTGYSHFTSADVEALKALIFAHRQGMSGQRPASVASADPLDRLKITALKNIAKAEGLTGFSHLKADDADKLRAMIINHRNTMNVRTRSPPREFILPLATMLQRPSTGAQAPRRQLTTQAVRELEDMDMEYLQELTFSQLMAIARREGVDLEGLPRDDIDELRERILERAREEEFSDASEFSDNE